MKALVPFLTLAAPILFAQDVAPKDSERDPILTALLESDPAAGPTVTVDLSATPYGDPGILSPDPVLVTGNPPFEALLAAEERPGQEDVHGVTVEVEAGNSRNRVDASRIKLLAPFPAKPIKRPPTGWKLVHPDDVPAVSKPVELANGTRLSLSIRPHVLVPDADGHDVLAISEPGFDATQEYSQSATLGSILADSIIDLDEDSVRLSDAVDRLQQLLSSLPTPAPKAQPIGNQ